MKKSMPLVTIYIPCHNYGRFLSQSVDSVLAQLYTAWELFIIDDGSTDDTAVIAQAYADKHPEFIKFRRNDTPRGLQRIANEILGVAQGQYIVRLDGDDWLDESALTVLVSRALKEDKPAIIYGSYYYVSEDGQIIAIERQPKLWDEDCSGIIPPHGACTLVQTRSLKMVGGYSEDITAQDGWELWFKLLGRANTANVATPVFYYRQHGNSLSRSAERLFAARAKIFSRLAEQLHGGYQPKILAVLPVRESYPHFKGVPYAELCGRSLMERAIAEAQAVPMVTDVMVTADSRAVLDFGTELERQDKVGAHLRVLRPPELCGDYIHLLSILIHAGEQFEVLRGESPDIVLFLNLHAVRRTALMIAKSIDTLLVTQSDTVVSVVEERDPVFVHSEKGIKLIGNGRFDNLHHRSEQLFRFNGSVIASWWDVIQNGALWGGRTGYIQMTRQESDTLAFPSDLPLFEEYIKRRN
ncbi:MAG: glycosyltransferase [Kiritimatiellae bacterium]|nr:glycosyltransferase [Kiritimatiellia bacterium]